MNPNFQSAFAALYALGVILVIAPLAPGQQRDENKRQSLEPRAEPNDAEAQYKLGERYFQGKDKEEAVKWYRRAAEQGHAQAQGQLGYCYAFGEGVAEDEGEAVKWYKKAADQGGAGAQYRLGMHYHFDGQGVAKDAMEAVKWYRKAADQGHAASQYVLGRYYDEGKVVPKDQIEAVKWYLKAANNQDAWYRRDLLRCCNKLGHCYYNGNGVKRGMWRRP